MKTPILEQEEVGGLSLMVIDIWAKDVETGDVVFVMEKNICKKIKNMSSLHLPRLLNGDTWRHTSL